MRDTRYRHRNTKDPEPINPGPVEAIGEWLNKREQERQHKRRCYFCGRLPGFTCHTLYLVTGGALHEGKKYLLCELCTQAETRAGAVARPYRLMVLCVNPPMDGAHRGVGVHAPAMD